MGTSATIKHNTSNLVDNISEATIEQDHITVQVQKPRTKPNVLVTITLSPENMLL